ncbi:cytochrome P450 [Actinomadura gamaensis]|uniref:Cytochrome P450 n=1 Tax=Actinomadura gamaensis TaxID=1763541 RepID=A0ABV9TT17_9ACTN
MATALDVPLFRPDPYRAYARLREKAPVYRDDECDFWALSRHADVSVAFRDAETFSSRNGNMLDPLLWGPDAAAFASISAIDPPRHTLVRGLVSRAFTRARLARLEPRIAEIANGHLDRALDGGEFDLVAEFTSRLPVDVIGELIGVPAADRAEIWRLECTLVDREDETDAAAAERARSMAVLTRYFADLVVERRRNPRDDLASEVVAAADADGTVTESEVLALLLVLVLAGGETTSGLIANAVDAVWRFPEARDAAYAGIDGWVEETLRFEPPFQFAGRTLTRDLTLHGVEIPEGERVLLLLASANRDGEVFDDPDRFDPTRDTSAKVTFGSGHHHCVGAQLARLEARVALREFSRRVADYEIDGAQAQRAGAAQFRDFTYLPIRVTPRPA